MGEASTEQAARGVFTRYVRALDQRGEPPDQRSFEATWQALRAGLRRELCRRGLWRRSPSYLGFYGWPRWTEAKRETWDALDELAADCYCFIFVQRVASLRAQLLLKPNVEGLVFLNIGHFVHGLQRRHDALGTRIFTIMRCVIREAVDAGILQAIEGDPGVSSDTVLAFSDVATGPASEATLNSFVGPWCEDLLPELLTTRGKGQVKLNARIRTKVLALEGQGIGAFRFRDLVSALRGSVRRHWTAILEQNEMGEEGTELTGDDVPSVVKLVSPDTTFEARQSFRQLLDCVGRELAGLDPKENDDRARAELQAIWDLLVVWASEGAEGCEALLTQAPSDTDKTPSRREIGRLLRIPRGRLPGLYGKLGDLVRKCRSAEQPVKRPAAVDSSPPPTTATKMSEELQARLLRTTAEAVARTSDEAPPEPRPGSVYLLRASAAWPVEWVVLQADPAHPERVIAVPSDTQPLAGRADLSLAEVTAGGPTTLRCGLAISLPRNVFELELFTRTLRAEDLGRALETWRQQIAGSGVGSLLQEENELDPAYREWMEEVPEAARAAIASATRSSLFARPRRGARWIEVLAASLAIASLGLTFLFLSQKRELARLSEPSFEPPVRELPLGGPLRDPEPWRLSPRTNDVLLYLVLQKTFDCDSFQLTILDAFGRELWTNADVKFIDGEVKLVLPRGFLDRGPARLRLLGLCGGERKLLDEIELAISWTEGE